MRKIRCESVMTDKKAPASMTPGASDWRYHSWRVTLRRGGRRMSVDFFTGELAGEPDAEGVMECLCADALGVENARSFGEWAQEYGYEMKDIVAAEEAWNAARKNTAKMRRFLGADFHEIVGAEDVRKFCD